MGATLTLVAWLAAAVDPTPLVVLDVSLLEDDPPRIALIDSLLEGVVERHGFQVAPLPDLEDRLVTDEAPEVCATLARCLAVAAQAFERERFLAIVARKEEGALVIALSLFDAKKKEFTAHETVRTAHAPDVKGLFDPALARLLTPPAREEPPPKETEKAIAAFDYYSGVPNQRFNYTGLIIPGGALGITFLGLAIGTAIPLNFLFRRRIAFDTLQRADQAFLDGDDSALEVAPAAREDYARNDRLVSDIGIPTMVGGGVIATTGVLTLAGWLAWKAGWLNWRHWWSE